MSSSRPLSSASATVAMTFLRLVTPLHESFTFLLDTDDCLTDYTPRQPFSYNRVFRPQSGLRTELLRNQSAQKVVQQDTLLYKHKTSPEELTD
jgi:hypothetical protein